MKDIHLFAIIFYYGASYAETDRVSVSVMEGDSVTLNTGVQTKQQEQHLWYLKNTRIAKINGDYMCTDVQCNEGTERFRDRLKLDHQTASLTIMNTRTSDSGEYTLQIISDSNCKMIFSVAVHGLSAAEQDEVKRKTVKEGQSVSLHPGIVKNTNAVMKWYFNDILIAEITGDQSQICTDVQCKERFRDRLKLDHQTGSLNITHTTNTDSGEYQLQIISNSSSFRIRRRRRSSSVTIEKSYIVSVITGPDLGLSGGAIAGISAAAAVVVVAGLTVIACAIKKGSN